MNPNRLLVLAFLLPLLVVSWLLIAILEPSGPSPYDHILIGFIFGTMFGQATLASAWTAIGPLPLLWRLPLSLGWIASLVIAFLLNVAFHSPPSVEIALIMSICTVGQWLVVQIPFWGLAVGYGLRL